MGPRGLMESTRILAYVAGTIDQELLLRNEYPAAENRIPGFRTLNVQPSPRLPFGWG